MRSRAASSDGGSAGGGGIDGGGGDGASGAWLDAVESELLRDVLYAWILGGFGLVGGLAGYFGLWVGWVVFGLAVLYVGRLVFWVLHAGLLRYCGGGLSCLTTATGWGFSGWSLGSWWGRLRAMRSLWSAGGLWSRGFRGSFGLLWRVVRWLIRRLLWVFMLPLALILFRLLLARLLR